MVRFAIITDHNIPKQSRGTSRGFFVLHLVADANLEANLRPRGSRHRDAIPADTQQVSSARVFKVT